MSSVFRHLTLNRIGAGLFVVGVVLLLAGVPGVVVSASSGESATVWVVGLTGGQALLLGLAGLVSSALVFAHAITHERLVRIESKLDALARQRGGENLVNANREPETAAVRPGD
jgi:hypothetical protein